MLQQIFAGLPKSIKRATPVVLHEHFPITGCAQSVTHRQSRLEDGTSVLLSSQCSNHWHQHFVKDHTASIELWLMLEQKFPGEIVDGEG